MFEDSPRHIESLFDRPSPAVLTTYRNDGTASVSPVWFRFHQRNLEVVVAEGDPKLRHLEQAPRCSLTVFETAPPFRGVRVEGSPRLTPDEDNEARLEIATRYLGKERGRRFVEQRGTPGLVLRIEANKTKSWDLSEMLPGH
jgi:PPOX class probable F420-dependent enzyme